MARLEDAARSASWAKGDFLANMSHEILTPLTAILGDADLLEQGLGAGDGTAPSAAMSHLDVFRAAGAHLLGVINDILDLSKIEAGKLQVEHMATDLRAALGEVEAMPRGHARSKGRRFVCLVTAEVTLYVCTAPVRLPQVLMHLVGHAIKFTESCGVQVRVATEPASKGGESWVLFDIADTGPGLNPAQSAQLFEPFNQGNSSTTRRHGGTGARVWGWRFRGT